MELLPINAQASLLPKEVEAVQRFENGKVSFKNICALRIYHLAVVLFELFKVAVVIYSLKIPIFLPLSSILVLFQGYAFFTSIQKAGKAVRDQFQSGQLFYHLAWLKSPKKGAWLDLREAQHRLNSKAIRILTVVGTAAHLAIFYYSIASRGSSSLSRTGP